jgi:hypothetical protein
VWREGARVIAVGGSTLGGSGKTPLAIACADALHRAGERVALVGHAYRGRPGRPRFVSVGDDVGEVGDEALECAARLAPYGVPVVVAETRQRALDLALEVADVAVVDGLGQAKPRRASLALLAVDAASPWGAGRCRRAAARLGRAPGSSAGHHHGGRPPGPGDRDARGSWSAPSRGHPWGRSPCRRPRSVRLPVAGSLAVHAEGEDPSARGVPGGSRSGGYARLRAPPRRRSREGASAMTR